MVQKNVPMSSGRFSFAQQMCFLFLPVAVRQYPVMITSSSHITSIIGYRKIEGFHIGETIPSGESSVKQKEKISWGKPSPARFFQRRAQWRSKR